MTSGTDTAVDYMGGDPKSPAPLEGAKLVIGDGCVRLIHEHFPNMLHRRDLVIEVAAAELRGISVGPPKALRALLEARVPSFVRSQFRFGARRLAPPKTFDLGRHDLEVAVVLAYERAGTHRLLVLSTGRPEADLIADDLRRLRTAAGLPGLPALVEDAPYV